MKVQTVWQSNYPAMAPFSNERSEDRRRLIEALWTAGYSASEFDSGGGTVHVVVALLNNGEDLLQIATGAIESACDVSLMGWRAGEQVQADVWIPSSTLEEALAAFQKFWEERGFWLQRFHAGELDL